MGRRIMIKRSNPATGYQMDFPHLFVAKCDYSLSRFFDRRVNCLGTTIMQQFREFSITAEMQQSATCHSIKCTQSEWAVAHFTEMAIGRSLQQFILTHKHLQKHLNCMITFTHLRTYTLPGKFKLGERSVERQASLSH